MGGFLFQAQHNDLRRFASAHKAGGLSSCHPRHKGQDDATSPSSCPLPFLSGHSGSFRRSVLVAETDHSEGIFQIDGKVFHDHHSY